MQAQLPIVKATSREDWLNAMAAEFQALYFNGSFAPELPRCRYSCGWPRGRDKSIGQCFAAEVSADHTFEIFVSPELDDPIRVADVLLHQCIHSAVGLECKHRGAFQQTATACGLTGRMKETIAGPALRERLEALVDQIGAYPHAQLTAAAQGRKQSNRLLLLTCSNPDCGMKIRTTRMWLEKVGAPKCACGCQFSEGNTPLTLGGDKGYH